MLEETFKHYLNACFHFYSIINEKELLHAQRICAGETPTKENMAVAVMCGYRGNLGDPSTALCSHTQDAFIYIGTIFLQKHLDHGDHGFYFIYIFLTLHRIMIG